MTIDAGALHEAIEIAGIPIFGCDSTGAIQFRPQATTEQQSAAAAIAQRADILISEERRLSLQSASDWFDRKAAEGYDTGLGFRMRLGDDDATKLAVYLSNLTAQGKQASDQVALTDNLNRPRVVTFAQFQALATGYTTAFETNRGLWMAAVSGINSAETVEEINEALATLE